MEINDISALEKRKFTRVKENIFILCSFPLSSFDEFKAITCDISTGGLMFETEREVLSEDELKLEIYQPITSSKNVIFSIAVWTKVIWARKIEKDNLEEGENKYRVGIEFTKIEEEDKQRIANYVEECALQK